MGTFPNIKKECPPTKSILSIIGLVQYQEYIFIKTFNEIKMVEDYITKCAHVSIPERSIWRNIQKEVEKYFLGERPMDETIQVIDNMINIYLME